MLLSVKQAYPLDLVRTRLSAQTKTQYYTGIVHALRTIVRDEGARGLYRGLGATLLQVTPSLAINYTAYGTLRSHWLQSHGNNSHTVLSVIQIFSVALHQQFSELDSAVIKYIRDRVSAKEPRNNCSSIYKMQSNCNMP